MTRRSTMIAQFSFKMPETCHMLGLLFKRGQAPHLVTVGRVGCWSNKGKIPSDFCPSAMFKTKVLLRTMDLVDRCDNSTLVLLGDPKKLTLGDPKCPPIDNKWREMKLSVFDNLPNAALRHWSKAGAVVVDPGSGKIHRMSVTIPGIADSVGQVENAACAQALFTITMQFDCIAICKRLKHDGAEDVFIFSTTWSKKERPTFHCEAKPESAAPQARISEDEVSNVFKVKERTPRTRASLDALFAVQIEMERETVQIEMDGAVTEVGMTLVEFCAYMRMEGNDLNTEQEGLAVKFCKDHGVALVPDKLDNCALVPDKLDNCIDNYDLKAFGVDPYGQLPHACIRFTRVVHLRTL